MNDMLRGYMDALRQIVHMEKAIIFEARNESSAHLRVPVIGNPQFWIALRSLIEESSILLKRFLTLSCS